MRVKKKTIIVVAVVAAVGLAAFFGIKTVSGASPQAKSVSATPLAKMDLINTVSVTGTVKSEDAVNVYSTLSYQVKSVDVEVGDRVAEGQTLCQLDTEDLVAKIDQQTATLNNGQAKAQHNLAVAKKNFDVEKLNQEENYDAQLLNAQVTLEKAEKGVETAEINLKSANSKLSSDRRALKDFRESGGWSDDSDTFDPEYEQYRQAVTQGQYSVEQAQASLAEAKKAVEDAKASLKATQMQKQQALNSAQDQVNLAALNANMSAEWMALEELKKDLEDATVKAPVSGTVTAVMAKQGGSGQGLLFVIENTSDLRVDTKIQEYDIDSVAVGQLTKIKSDGTGDDEYAGKVAVIAPTALKTVTGETDETTDVQFATEIDVTSPQTRLKIGMNARLEIVTQEKKDVFAVPYDAVVENINREGEQIVYVARPKANIEADGGEASGEGETATANKSAQDRTTTFTVEEIAVTTGMETDFYMEIMSDKLHEGDLIISNPVGLNSGDEVMLSNSGYSGGAVNNGAGGPRGGMAVRVGG